MFFFKNQICLNFGLLATHRIKIEGLTTMRNHGALVAQTVQSEHNRRILAQT